VILTYLTTILFLYQIHYPKDDGITGRNMLVKTLKTKIHNKIKAYLLVLDTFYMRNT